MGIRKRFRHCGKYGESSAFAQVSYFPYSEPSTPRKGRQRKYQVSTPRQRELNNKRAVRYLEALVHSNFGEGDILASLSYSDEYQPKDEKEAKRLFGNFIGRLNYRLHKLGMENVKWVSVIERGKKSGRFHHHALLKCGLDRDTIEEIWGYGYGNTKRLQNDCRKGLLEVVHYIAKDSKTIEQRPQNTRKWDSSKNLIKPWDTVNDNPRMMSGKKYRQMKELGESTEDMRRIIEADNPGYELIDVEKEFREEFSAWYFFCRLRLAQKPPNRKKQKQKGKTKKQNINEIKQNANSKSENISRNGDARAKPPPVDKGPP